MSEIDEIWNMAREQAKEDLFGYDGSEELIANNPFVEGSSNFEEYEAAYEHYIMEGLGY